jgi:hypothetical protein
MYNRNNSTLHATQRCGPGRVFFFINIQRVVTKESCLSLNPHPRPFSQREKGEKYNYSSGDLIATQVVAQIGKQLVSLITDLQKSIKMEQLIPQFIHISFRQEPGRDYKKEVLS